MRPRTRLGTLTIAAAVASLWIGEGCIPSPRRIRTGEGYEWLLSTWEGRSASALINAWGPPDRSFPKPDGRTLYKYSKEVTYSEAGSSATYWDPLFNVVRTQYANGRSTTFKCETRIEVAGDEITWWAFEGNDCLYDAPPYLGARGKPASRGHESGILLSGVDGPAAAAGLRKGDLILHVGMVRVKSISDWAATLGEYSAGADVSLEFRRGNRLRRVTVRLGLPR